MPSTVRRIAQSASCRRGGPALTVAILGSSLLGHQSHTTVLVVASVALVAGAFVPRATWLVLAFAAVGGLALSGEPGSALVLAAALALSPVLMASDPWLWSLPALAPLLGLVGLAAAFPALAARAGGASARRRAALGAVAYCWVALAEALAGRRLLFGDVATARPRSAWESSLTGAFDHVLAPLCAPGRLAPIVLWAVAALVLPWILRDSTGLMRATLAIAWAGALVLIGVVLAHRIGASVPPLPLATSLVAIAVAMSLRRTRARVPARSGVT